MRGFKNHHDFFMSEGLDYGRPYTRWQAFRAYVKFMWLSREDIL